MTVARLAAAPPSPPLRAAVRSLFDNARSAVFFFALDGTIFDAAAGEEAEALVAETVTLLARLTTACDGAVAVLAEPPFAEIDRCLAPLRLAGGAGGGTELRGFDGEETRVRRQGDLDPVRRLLARPGAVPAEVEIRDEGASIVLKHGDHPDLVTAARVAAREAVALAPAVYAMRAGAGLTRIGFAGASLGRAMRRLMNDTAPIERIPVVFGSGRDADELHATARAFGGTSIEVGGRADHAADFALPGTNDVRWLIRDMLAELEEA